MRLMYLALAAGIGILIGAALYFGQSVIRAPHEAPEKPAQKTALSGGNTNKVEHVKATTDATSQEPKESIDYSDPEEYRKALPEVFQTPPQASYSYIPTTIGAPVIGPFLSVPEHTHLSSLKESPTSDVERTEDRAQQSHQNQSTPPKTDEPLGQSGSAHAVDAIASRPDTPVLMPPAEVALLKDAPNSAVKYQVSKSDGLNRTKTIVTK